ncbi:hypothetical protein [Gluconacetobacter takamatsuzukensis]|nr:hypothetical protein [Gluconacetobacter takamatsuzukensis]
MARAWRAAWPLVLLALVARLTLGGLASPQAVLADPLAQLASLSLICDSDHPLVPDPAAPHHAGDQGDGSLLLAEAHDTPALSVGGAAGFLALRSVVVGMAWVFPPVRGPPLQSLSSLYPQGPPALT